MASVRLCLLMHDCILLFIHGFPLWDRVVTNDHLVFHVIMIKVAKLSSKGCFCIFDNHCGAIKKIHRVEKSHNHEKMEMDERK